MFKKYFFRKKKGNKKVISNGDTTFYQFDSQIGFWGVPNIEKNVIFEQMPDVPINVKHNSDGNRDENITLNGHERTIICIGGSHTWGGGVMQENRYTNCLARSLNRTVINMGHCSLGLDQVILSIIQKSNKYNPEIIVIEQYPWAVHRVLNNYVNGYVRPYFTIDNKDKLQLHKLSKFAKIPFFRSIIGNYFSFRKEFYEFRGGINLKNSSNNFIDPMFACWKSRHYDYMYDIIDKLLIVIKDHCVRNKLKLFFSLGAIQQQFFKQSNSNLVDYTLPRERFIELLVKNRINYVDMTESMLAAHSISEPVIYDDGHINAKGHEIFAKILHQELIKLKWVSYDK